MGAFMKKSHAAVFGHESVVFALLCAMVTGAYAQNGKFEPGKLAVLRLGDGGTGGASDLNSRQTPVFIDQFETTGTNQAHPAFSVAVPTKGAGAIWINGNASTEGGM